MTHLKDKAIQAMLLGDWENATFLNKALLNDNPNDIDALNRLAYIFTILGKIKDAKSTYTKVLKLDMLNQIAIRNVKKLTDLEFKKNFKNGSVSIRYVNSTFLEETGRTKIISLVNTAQPKIIALLTAGQPVLMVIKRSKVFIQDQNKQYLGVLPDDIGRRLIRLIKGGNDYNVCIKSANQHNVVVFIKEIKRASKYKDQPSFLDAREQDLNFSKNKPRIKIFKEIKYEDADTNYSSDEEVS